MSVLNLSQIERDSGNFLMKVNTESGEDARKCYQCGKCSAGCPVAFAMDYRPNQILRMIQLGMKEEVLNSRTIWICATCATCTARCPRNVDLAKVMDTCRIISKREGKVGKVKNEVAFHDKFMNSIINHGRVYELGMAVGYYLKSGNLLQDADLGLPMFVKGKLGLFPPKFKGNKEIQRIVEAVKQLEGEE